MSSRATATRRSRAARGGEVGQRAGQAVGRLVEHDGAGLGGHAPPAARARPEPLRGRKPSNTKRPAGSPLTTRAASAAEGPGTTSTGCPAATAAAHQALARVGDAGHAGVGHDRDPLAPGQAGEHPRRSRGLGVVVDDHEGPALDPGVLRAAGRCGGCPRSRRRRPSRGPRRPGARGRRGCRWACPPARARRAVRSARSSPLDLELVARAQVPAGERARLGLDHGTAPAAPAGDTRWRRSARSGGRAGRRRRTPRRWGSACPRVCTERAGRSSSAPSMPSRPSRPRARARRPSAISRLASTSPSRSNQATEDNDAEPGAMCGTPGRRPAFRWPVRRRTRRRRARAPGGATPPPAARAPRPSQRPAG